MVNRVGQQFGNYHILRLLGRGGFAEVYLGEHRYLKSYAALKMLRASLTDKQASMFLSEAQTLVRLRHSNIVRVLEFAVEQGTAVLVMDYAPRGTLRSLHSHGSRLSLATTVLYVKQIAAALQYAHNHNIVHRDVKPENMLLDADLHLLLSDFGLALLTPSTNLLSTQEMAGTLPYAAPEQLRGKPCFASDQYALGIVIYEWLCGRRPFEGNVWEIINQHQQIDPPPLRNFSPALPTEVEAVVLRALAKEPQQRFASIQAFANALERASRDSTPDEGEDSEITASFKAVSASSAFMPAGSTRSEEATAQSIFLSASTADEAFAARLKGDLNRKGILFANEQNERLPDPLGQQNALQQALRAACMVLVVITSATRLSPTIEEHLRIAEKAQRRVVFFWAEGDNIAAILLDIWGKTRPMEVIDARHARYEIALEEVIACAQEKSGSSFPLNLPRSASSENAFPTLDPHVSPTVEATAGISQKRTKMKPSALPAPNVNRQRLLEKVRAFWITGVLEQSLHGAALIALGLHEQPDSVTTPWQLLLQQSGETPRALPGGTHIRQVYDDAGSELLILGEPGSGKTTLLLELARDLLDRAKLDEHHPMPVVFNLSSWAEKQQPLSDWLADELNSKYQVPRKLARSWVKTDQILPLLDGLDEVTPKALTACVEAINVFRGKHGLLPMVACSRSSDYLAQTARVLLARAVVVQPLTWQQIDAYLSSAGTQLEAVRVALQADAALRELVATPLMLNIIALAYQGKSVESLLAASTPETRRRQVFATYVQRMLTRRGSKARYKPPQTIHWLTWLAQQLTQRSQTQFSIERMQSDWLPGRWSRQLYYAIAVKPVGALIGLLVGILAAGLGIASQLAGAPVYGLIGLLVGVLISGGKAVVRTGKDVAWTRQRLVKVAISLGNGTIIGTMIGTLYEWTQGLSISLVNVSINGLIGGLIGLLVGALMSGRGTDIQPFEVVVWSWRRFVKVSHLRNGLVIGLGIGLINLLILPHYALIYGLFGALGVWLLNGLFSGLSSDILPEHNRVRPNQGIRRSARNAVLVGLIVGLASGLIVGLANGLVYGLLRGPDEGLGFALVYGPIYGLGIGILSGVLSGGDACVKHFVMRLLLRLSGCVPRNYSRFLDYAAERILLRKVGGGYIFTHRLLLDYFATLEAKTTPDGRVEQGQSARRCECGHQEDRTGSRFCPHCGKPKTA